MSENTFIVNVLSGNGIIYLQAMIIFAVLQLLSGMLKPPVYEAIRHSKQ